MSTIVELRKQTKLTQAQLAHALGVTVTTVSNWEQGKYDPNARQFREMCRLFAVAPDDIELPSDHESSKPDPETR